MLSPSSEPCFPTSIFFQELPNGEKVKRDWLVWSSSAQGLFCFACCLFQDLSQQEKRSQPSQLTGSDAGIKDNWKKLYEKIETPQRNSAHITCYLICKDLEKILMNRLELTIVFKNNLLLRWQNGVSFSPSQRREAVTNSPPPPPAIYIRGNESISGVKSSSNIAVVGDQRWVVIVTDLKNIADRHK